MSGDDTKGKAKVEEAPGQDGPAERATPRDNPPRPEAKELAEVRQEMRAKSGIIERPDGTRETLNEWAKRYFKKDDSTGEQTQCYFTAGYHQVMSDLAKAKGKLSVPTVETTLATISALGQDGIPKRVFAKTEAPESAEPEAASTLKKAVTPEYRTLEQLKEPSGFVNPTSTVRFGQAMEWGRLARAHDYSFARPEIMGPNKSVWWEKSNERNTDIVADYNRFQRLTANGIYGHVDGMKTNELRIWRQYASDQDKLGRVQYQRKLSNGDFRDFDRLGLVPQGTSDDVAREIKQDFAIAYNRLTIHQKGEYSDYLAAKIAITEVRKGNYDEIVKLGPGNKTVDLWLKGASNKERTNYANAVIDAQLKADTYEAANWFSSASPDKARLIFETLRDSRQEVEKESWWRKISKKDADEKEPFSRAQKLYMQYERDLQDGKVEPFKRGERFDFEETKKMSDEDRLRLGDYLPALNNFKSLTDEQKAELLKNATSDEKTAIKDLQADDQMMALYLNKINAPGSNTTERMEKFKQFVINDTAGYISHVDKMTGNQMRRWLAAAGDEQRQRYLDYQDKKQAGDYSFVTNENFEQFKADMKMLGPKREAAELANYARYRDRIDAGDFSFLKNLKGENKDRLFTKHETEKLIDFTFRLASGDYSFVLKQKPENQQKWYREASFEDKKAFDNFRQQLLSGNFSSVENYLAIRQPPVPPEKMQEERAKWIADLPPIAKKDGHLLTPPGPEATPEQLATYNETKFDVAAAYARYTKDVDSYKGLHGKSEAEKQEWLKQHPEHKETAAHWQKLERLGDHSFLNKLPKSDKDAILEYYKKNPESKEAQGNKFYENRIAKGDYSHIYLLDKDSFEKWKSNSSPEERARYKDFVNRINAGDLSFVDRFDEATRQDWIARMTELMSSTDARTSESSTELMKERQRYVDRTRVGDWSMFDKLNDRNFAATIADATKEQWEGYQKYKEAIKNGDYSFVDRLRTKDGESTEALKGWILTSSKEEKENYAKYRSKISPEQPLNLSAADKTTESSSGASQTQYLSTLLEAKYRNPQLDAQAVKEPSDPDKKSKDQPPQSDPAKVEKVDPAKAKQHFETLMTGLSKVPAAADPDDPAAQKKRESEIKELFKQVDAKAVTAYLAAEPSVREPFVHKLKKLVAENRDPDAVKFVREMTSSGHGIDTMFKDGLGFANGGLAPSKTIKLEKDEQTGKDWHRDENLKRAADTATPVGGLLSKTKKLDEISSTSSVLASYWNPTKGVEKKLADTTGTVDKPAVVVPPAPPKNSDEVRIKVLGDLPVLTALKQSSASRVYNEKGQTIADYDKAVAAERALAPKEVKPLGDAAADKATADAKVRTNDRPQALTSIGDALYTSITQTNKAHLAESKQAVPKTDMGTSPGKTDILPLPKDLSFSNRPTAKDSTWSNSEYKSPDDYVKRAIPPTVKQDEYTRTEQAVKQDRASAEVIAKQQQADAARVEERKDLIDQARKLVSIPDEVARKLDIALNNDPATLKQLAQLLRTTSDKGVDIVSLSALLAANDKTADSRQRSTEPASSNSKSALVDPSGSPKIVSLSELTNKGTSSEGRISETSNARQPGDFIGIGKVGEIKGSGQDLVVGKAGAEIISVTKGPIFDPSAKGSEVVRLASGELVVTKGNIEIAGTGIKVAPNDIVSALVGQNIKFDVRTDGRIPGVEIASNKIGPAGLGNEMIVGKGEHAGIRILGPGELGVKGSEISIREGRLPGEKFIVSETGTVKAGQGINNVIFIPGIAGSIKTDGSTKGDRLPDTLQTGKDPAPGIGLGSGTIGQGGTKGQPGQNQNDPTLGGLNIATSGGVQLQPVNLPTVQITGQDPKATGTAGGTDPDKKKDPADPQQTGTAPDPGNKEPGQQDPKQQDPKQQDPQAQKNENGMVKQEQSQPVTEVPQVKPTETITPVEAPKTGPDPFINMEPHGPIVPVINHWEPKPAETEPAQKPYEAEPVRKPIEVEPAIQPEAPRQLSPAEQLLINQQLIELLNQTQQNQEIKPDRIPEHREIIDKKDDSQTGRIEIFSPTTKEDPLDPAAILRNTFEQLVGPVAEQTNFDPLANPIETSIEQTIAQVIGDTNISASTDQNTSEVGIVVNTLLNGPEFTESQSGVPAYAQDFIQSGNDSSQALVSASEVISEMLAPQGSELITEVQAAIFDLNNDKDSSVEEKVKSLLQKHELDEKNRREMEEEELRKLEESKLAALALLDKLRERQAREAKEAEARREAAKKQTERPVEKLEARRKYIVLRGDTLESIAARTLRNKRLAGLLFDINKSRIPVKKVDGRQLLQLTPRLVLMLPTQAEVVIYLSSATKPRVFEYDQNLQPNDLQSLINTKTNGKREAAASAPTVSPEEALNENPRINYSCRLGETLKSIAMNHPSLKDCTLWKLIARINNLSTDIDFNGNPVCKLVRGQIILLPSAKDIAEYNTSKNTGSGR